MKAGNVRNILKIGLVLVLFAVLSAAAGYLLWAGGGYPAGEQTMYHLYRADALYTNVAEGKWCSLYDPYWYNGTMLWRYQAPLSAVVLALCRWAAGGSCLQSYYFYIGFLLFLNLTVFLMLGIRRKREILACVLGFVWCFMPYNLRLVFVEGKLDRALALSLLPLLLCFLMEYLVESAKGTKLVFAGEADVTGSVYGILPVYGLILFSDVSYGVMIFVAVAVFLVLYRILWGPTGKCFSVIPGMLLGFLLLGIWLYPSVVGAPDATQGVQVMKSYFQNLTDTLNPLERITGEGAIIYFGLAAFFVAVFGILCSHKKTVVCFLTALLLLISSSHIMYGVFSRMPGNRYFYMLEYTAIALCLILCGLLHWKTLKRRFVVVCLLLLVLDIIPSLGVIEGAGEKVTALESLADFGKENMLTAARDITSQRVLLLDEHTLGSAANYVLTGSGEDKRFQSSGGVAQSYATAENLSLLSDAMKAGCYAYVFDRALELGNDTVLIAVNQLEYKDADVERVKQAGADNGFFLVKESDRYLLFHIDTYDSFGTITRYHGLGIGSSAALMSLTDPDIETGWSQNLNDYTYEELCGYQVIYLAGFTYDDKEAAEELLRTLAKGGVRVVINGDGIPVNAASHNQEFLGVTCHEIQFENGYPILHIWDEDKDMELFGESHENWQTVYFTGLYETEGYLRDNERILDFFGRTEDGIYFLGLNLTYHYYLTKDEAAGEVFTEVTGGCLRQLPDRKLVPVTVEYDTNRITVTTEEDGVNTALAYYDNMRFNQKNRICHNLIVVDSGSTIITIAYPHLIPGLLLTMLGVILTFLYYRNLLFDSMEWKRKVCSREYK